MEQYRLEAVDENQKSTWGVLVDKLSKSQQCALTAEKANCMPR